MTEIGSHRAPRGRIAESLASTGALVGAGALILAALAVGSLIPGSDENIEHRERPFVAAGQVGDQRSTREIDITVTEVRGVGKIKGDKRIHDTAGIWVIVKVRVTARAEAGIIGYAAVRDSDGRTFELSARIEQPLEGRTLQPGIPVTGELVFEMPRDAATDLTVLFADRAFDRRMDVQVEIDLPEVDRAQVDRWAAAGPTTVAETEVAL
jgi:hypothetical protein